jgi:hypothetical protein|tara:strand:- start:460 stop:1107 length:648 start_codon:yes stop_codon:yes gene_type:complete
MSEEIYSIILGNNQDELFGSENDAILIYNLFYTFYLKNKVWKKPIVYLNEDVNMENLINSMKNIDSNSTIIIYFSGHSCKNGNLQFFNYYYSNNEIINEILNIKKQNIYFIIDSCYSKKFITSRPNIKTKYIVSTSDIQTSKEIIIDYQENMFTHMNNSKENNKIVLGIFTLYFYKILLNKNLVNIKDWKNKIINNKIWDIIDRKYNQKIYYYES